MRVTIFILVKCCVSLLIKGQVAPGDRQQICHTDQRYYDVLHDWIPYVNDTSDGVAKAPKRINTLRIELPHSEKHLWTTATFESIVCGHQACRSLAYFSAI